MSPNVLLLFLLSIAIGLGEVASDDIQLDLKDAVAIGNSKTLKLLSDAELRFTLTNPTKNCTMTSSIDVIIDGCEMRIQWKSAQFDLSGHFIKINVNVTELVVNITPDGLKIEGETMEHGYCYLGNAKTVNFTVKKVDDPTKIPLCSVNMAFNNVEVVDGPVDGEAVGCAFPPLLIVGAGTLVALVAIIGITFCVSRNSRSDGDGSNLPDSPYHRRAADKTQTEQRPVGAPSPAKTKSVVGDAKSMVPSQRTDQSALTNEPSKAAQAKSVLSTAWDAHKDVRPGPLDPRLKFDRMIDFKSKSCDVLDDVDKCRFRKPIETLNFIPDATIVMLPEPGMKMYKWQIEIENRSNSWASYIARHGAQHLRQGEGSDCVQQGKQKLVPFIRSLEPWLGWELAVFQMKQFPVRRWGGLPFPENVEFFHRVEHGTADHFVYITGLMSDEEQTKFYEDRLVERRAMMRAEDRKTLPTDFKAIVAPEAIESEIKFGLIAAH